MCNYSEIVSLPSQVTKEAYREGMSFLPGGVNIITTDGPAGRAGFTASAVCSVTDDPPTLLVCVKRESSVGPAFMSNRALCVNVAAGQHNGLAMVFGGKTPSETRFREAEWYTLESGAPVLKDSVAAFDCDIVEWEDVGTHRVLFCRVLAVAMTDAPAVSVYVARRFHSLELSPLSSTA